MYPFHACHGYTDTYLEQVVVVFAIGRSHLAWQIILAGCQAICDIDSGLACDRICSD